MISIYYLLLRYLLLQTSALTVETPISPVADTLLLSPPHFSHLSKTQKAAYIQELRVIFLELVGFQSKAGVKIADLDSMKGFAWYLRVFPIVIDAIASEPQTSDVSSLCIVGGVIQSLEKNAANELVCSTKNQICNNNPMKFRCGEIYGANVCVNRYPLGNLSERCHSSARPVEELPLTDPNWYPSVTNSLSALQESICKNKSSNPEACQYLNARLVKIKNKIAAVPQLVIPSQAVTPEVKRNKSLTSVVPASKARIQQAPTTSGNLPTPSEITEDCKGVTTLLIEGTRFSPNSRNAEKTFHEQAIRMIKGSQSFSKQTHVILPYRPIDRLANPGGFRQYANEISSAINQPKYAPQNNRGMIAGLVAKLTSPKRLDLCVLSYKFEDTLLNPSLLDQEPIKSASNYGYYDLVPEENIQTFDPTSVSLENSGASVFSKLKEMSNRCPHKKDLTVILSIHAPGNFDNQDCYFKLSKNKQLRPQHVFDNIIRPLENLGTKVVMNGNSGASGCFSEQVAKLAQPVEPPSVTAQGLAKARSQVCILGRPSHPFSIKSEGGLLSWTYDFYYPYFLEKFKNPLAAHVCAMALDPLGVDAKDPVYSTAGQPAGPNKFDASKVSGEENQLFYSTLKTAIGKLSSSGSNLKLGSLLTECRTVGQDIPKLPFQVQADQVDGAPTTSDRKKPSDLFNCEPMKKLLTKYTGLRRAFSDRAFDTSKPGVHTLKKWIEESNNSALRNCDLSLGDPLIPNTLPAAETFAPKKHARPAI